MTSSSRSDLDSYICPVCGEELKLHWKRCPGCDTRILDSPMSGSGSKVVFFILIWLLVAGLIAVLCAFFLFRLGEGEEHMVEPVEPIVYPMGAEQELLFTEVRLHGPDTGEEQEEIVDEPPSDGDKRSAAIGIGAGGPSGGKYGKRASRDRENRIAVDKGLDWLRRHQDPGGFWDSDGFCRPCDEPYCLGQGEPLNDVGVTGLALLAFLGDGNTPFTGPYRKEVKKAINYLIEIQAPADGCLMPRVGTHWMYNHAIGTLALVEAYGLSRMPVFKRPAERALRFIHENKNPGRAWRYNNGEIDPVDQNDVSVTGWMVQCLVAANDFGLPCHENDLKDALSYIDEMTDPAKGRTGYKERGSFSAREAGDETAWPFGETEAMTAAGMLCRIFAGHALDDLDAQRPALEAGARLLLRKPPAWNEKRGCIDFYYWYYGTHAMFQMGGEGWHAWRTAMEKALLENQGRTGCERGSWNPKKGPWGNNGGRVYATALGTLCLQASFRFDRLWPVPVLLDWQAADESDSIVRINPLPPIAGCDERTFDRLTLCLELGLFDSSMPELKKLELLGEFEAAEWRVKIPILINAFNDLDMLDPIDVAAGCRIAAIWNDITGKGMVDMPIKGASRREEMEANLIWNLTAVQCVHRIWERKISDADAQLIFFEKCEKHRKRQLEKERRGSGTIRVSSKYVRRFASKGESAAQESVDSALKWLARHQDPEGFWDSDGFCALCGESQCSGQGQALNDVGVTGLALLAFLGTGNTTHRGPYRDVIRKGIKFLVDCQDPENGCLVPREGIHWMYNHAIGTLALTEAYGLSRWLIIENRAQRALDFIHKNRNPGKAWRYNNGEIVPAEQNDVSVTAWCVICLVTAADFGLRYHEQDLKDALRYLDDMTDQSTGRTGYNKRGLFSSRVAGGERAWPLDRTEAMTAAAMFCRVFSGRVLDEIETQRPALGAGARLLRARLPEWDKENGCIDFYYWYYGSHAMIQMGGGDWKAWKAALVRALTENQRRDGCESGSWDPLMGPWGSSGGRVYTTALCALSLEAAYRYGNILHSK